MSQRTSKRGNAMDSALSRINEELGTEVLFRPRSAPNRVKYRIPFTSPTLNRLSGGGVMVPRFTQFYGPSSVYKSTGLYDLIANAQRLKKEQPHLMGDARRIVLIDAEKSMTLKYMEQRGIDLDDPEFAVGDSFENGDHAVDVMCDLMSSGECMLIVLDSLTALIGGREDETQHSDFSKNVGYGGRFTSKMFQKLNSRNKGTTAFVFSNQVRADIGAAMGRAAQNKGGGTPTGGNAPVFFSSDVIEFSTQTEEVEASYSKQFAPHGFVDRRRFTGNVISARIEKTRGSGQQNTELFFRYIPETGRMDMEAEIITLAQIDGIITNKGAHYYYKLPDMEEPVRIGQGKNNVRIALMKDRELFDKLRGAIDAKSREIGEFE